MKLSIIIPVYNEKATLLKIIAKVRAVNLGNVKKEIIIVDDASRDGTTEIIRNIKNAKKVFHKINMGKGAAIREGIKKSSGEIIIVQDADLEYCPEDYKKVIQPILEGKEKVVYGSRALGRRYKYAHFSYFLGGKLVTLMTNLLFFSRLTDEPTCYKMFRSEIIKNIKIESNRFEWEPEVTAKILRSGINIHEVPIRYTPRDKSHGKKIGWKDGFLAIWTLIKYRFKN